MGISLGNVFRTLSLLRFGSYLHSIIRIINLQLQAVANDGPHEQWVRLVTNFENIVLVDEPKSSKGGLHSAHAVYQA